MLILNFSYVFEQLDPTAADMSTLKMVCAAWGDWDPPQVPRCVRKCFIIYDRGPDFFFVYVCGGGGGVTINSLLVFLAVLRVD